ncbi:nucleotidyltransferase domain-containing protein [Blastococcus aurantiacus]|nr:nucleotidyltransferase family protein [Blastococcus aurantiacus]
MRERIARVRAVERVLTGCVREHDWTETPSDVEAILPAVDQSRLVDLALRHRVVAPVLTSLAGSSAFDPDVRRRLRALTRMDHLRSLQVEGECRHVGAALRETPWLVVKGPALARGYYRRPELRAYGDLDILVRPADFALSLERLSEAGYRLLDRNWTHLLQTMSGEVHLLSPRGVLVDLHWDLTNDLATRESYAMVARSFFERAEPVRIADAEFQTLDPLDTVVHTAVHAARSGGDRLVWMKDLEQLVLAGRFTWPALAVRSAEHHAILPVTVMLHRMRATLDVPRVSHADLRSLGGPRTWQWVGKAVDRFAPLLGAGPDGSIARMYARSTRSDSRSASTELARRLVARARRGTWPDENNTLNPAHPESVLYDSGGGAGRAAFLDAVLAHDWEVT